MSSFDTYSTRFRNIAMKRDGGIVEVRIHNDGAEAVWTAGAREDLHGALGDAFYAIGRDRDTRVVILTGTGDEFLAQMKRPDLTGYKAEHWDRLYQEGKDLLMNLLDIPVPVIGAVNGPATIHSELPTMSDIVIASEKALFADKAHAPGGVVPGDGVHVWWPMLLGMNRGRHFLWTGAEIAADEALRLGVVAEVVPHGKTLDRAWEIARDLAKKDIQMLRYSRAAFTQHIKRRMTDDLGYGLMLEGFAMMSLLGK